MKLEYAVRSSKVAENVFSRPPHDVNFVHILQGRNKWKMKVE